MGIIYLVIVGIAAGYIATKVMRIEANTVQTIAIGIAGALIGGFLLRMVLALSGLWHHRRHPGRHGPDMVGENLWPKILTTILPRSFIASKMRQNPFGPGPNTLRVPGPIARAAL